MSVSMYTELKVVYWQTSPFCGRGQFFFFLRPSTDWVSPINIIEDNLLYLESTGLSINPIQKNTPKYQNTAVKFDLGTMAQAS